MVETAGSISSLCILETEISVFGSCDEAVHAIGQRIALRQPTLCVAINPEKIYRAKRDPRLRGVLDSAHLRICDGAGISLAAMALHGKRLPRCTGIDLFVNLIRHSAQEGWRVFLLGASPDVNDAAYSVLMDQFPSLKIVGRQHGFFEDSAKVIESINDSGADLLFVGMGSPRQEFWIGEQMANLKTPFCMGVGGSFDVVSGAVKRAPAPFRKTGTELLYRLLVQPSRLRRQVALPLFALQIVREKFSPR
jgi:N-acetylglucosaminyldiphosphoundecaprenol N-acetyl-beta-D-mannosaminyltransferase